MRRLLFIAIFCGSAWQLEAATIAVTRLSESSFILRAADSTTNIGLLKTSKGLVLIDPAPGKDNLQALNQRVEEIAGEAVSFILTTHQDEDHSAGNPYFIAQGARLLSDTIQLPGIESRLVRSHSKEDRIYLDTQSNCIFVGDIYDASWHPTFYAGGVQGFKHAVESILNMGNEDSIIVPGHGKPGDKAAVRRFYANTLDWVERVKILSKQGLTANDMRNDSDLLAILARFNSEGKQEFIPEKALLRFIERTITVLQTGL